MAEIKVILFDLDDTLLDFKQAEKNSIRTCFSLYGLGQCSDEMLADYSRINISFWEKLERQEMTKNEILEARFHAFLEKYGFTDIDAKAFNLDYELHLADTAATIPCAMDVLKGLQGKVRLMLVTNGVKVTQDARIEKNGIGPFVEHIFISEEVGAEKPSPVFFDAVFKTIPEISKEEILIVGDSLTSDMKGGIMAGIKTCWFNPKGKENTSGLKPDFEIRFLNQIFDLLPHLQTKISLLGYPSYPMKDMPDSFGGSQEWFFPYVEKEDEAKKRMGCGVVALADAFLYLTKKREEISLPETERMLQMMHQGNRLSKEAYKEFFNDVYKYTGRVTKKRGLTGLQVAGGFNRICRKYHIPLRAGWHVGHKHLLQEIEQMLQEDLPVIFSIPFVFFKGKDTLPFYREEKRLNGYELVERNRAHSHYVTVTGIETRGEDTYLRIASWGRQYVISYKEYLVFSKKQLFGFVTGNILKIKKK